MTDINKNKVTLAGFLCADSAYDENHTRLTFRIGNNRSEKNPVFASITAWGDNAKQYAGLMKGDAVQIKGHLRTSQWTTNGEKRYGWEIVTGKNPSAITVISTKAEKTLAAEVAEIKKDQKTPTTTATKKTRKKAMPAMSNIVERLMKGGDKEAAKLAKESPIVQAFEAGTISGAQVEGLTQWGKDTGDTWTFLNGQHLINNATGEMVENDQTATATA